MKQVCAWCESLINENPEIAPDLVSHGICRQCQPKLLREGGMSEKEIQEIMEAET